MEDKFEMEKRGEDHLNYQASDLPAQWQFDNPSSSTCQRNQMSDPCPSSSMVDSFCPSLWNHPTNAQTSVTSSNSTPIGKPVSMLPRLDMGNVFLPARPNVLPPSLSHFPADSAFIERAARLSCFNGGSFSGMVTPFGTNYGSVIKDQRDKGSLCSKESEEPDLGGNGREGTPNLHSASDDSSSKDLGAKRRKRSSQEMELEPNQESPLSPTEAAKENADGKQKDERNSTKATTKAAGKQPKDSSEASKEDYIHKRARRGQATNSHSLAERVRREKISERMKYLQDLVPGCSKVTGKAVMLDEIINYVQSLQRQVEFLSMKLATVNPRLDYNIEGILSKDFLLARDGPSSAMGFSNDMIHPQSHLAQQGLIPSGIAYPSDALRRALSAQLTMMPNSWDDEFHNVFQMNFSTANPPLNSHALSDNPPDGFPK